MTTAVWSRWPDLPDWLDTGKRVEVELEDGSIVQGELFVADFIFDGEDEVPMFEVRTDGGRETRGFAANKRWRFL
jgi:hypothetical protein